MITFRNSRIIKLNLSIFPVCGYFGKKPKADETSFTMVKAKAKFRDGDTITTSYKFDDVYLQTEVNDFRDRSNGSMDVKEYGEVIYCLVKKLLAKRKYINTDQNEVKKKEVIGTCENSRRRVISTKRIACR